MRALTKPFIRAWRDWLRLTPPTRNFRQNRSEAPTYGIELALDHSASFVHSLGSSVIDGKEYDFVKLASDELEELNKLVLELETCNVDVAEKEELSNYIDATRALLGRNENRCWMNTLSNNGIRRSVARSLRMVCSLPRTANPSKCLRPVWYSLVGLRRQD